MVCLTFIALTPLKIGSLVFSIGTLLIAPGLIGLTKALCDIKNTPLNEPVTRNVRMYN